MVTMSGFDVQSGERVFIENADNSGFFDDVAETAAWKKYIQEFGATDENNSRLQEVVAQLYPSGDPLTVSHFVDALNTGMAADEFSRKPVERQPVVEDEEEVAHDRNGRLLTEPQRRWSEYKQFSETHSMKEVRERARVDAVFASFMTKNLEREMAGGVGDEVVNLNARPDQPKQISRELLAFAAEYNATPSNVIRKLKRADFNPLGYEQFNKKLEAAIVAGLI
jgi:hypothetical protein